VSNIFDHIHRAFHVQNTPSYRVVDGIVWITILLSISVFGIDMFLGDAHPQHTTLQTIDQLFIGFFVIELVLRVGSFLPPELQLLRQNPASWLRTHVWGRCRYCFTPMIVIDFLAILGGASALRGLRALRLLRLLRLLRNNRVFRYSNPFYGTFQAFQYNGLLYVVLFTFLGMATIVGGVSIYLIEGDVPDNGINSIADGLWWGLVTLTTVGYGDVSPSTPLGRILGGVLMIGGMFTLALFAGVVGQTLLRSVLSIREEQFRMSTMMNHVVICGYEPGARMLLDAVTQELDLGQVQVVVFGEGLRPSDLPPDFAWITGDPTKESSLAKVRMVYASAVIVVGQRSLLPQAADANTILTTFTIRSYLSKSKVAQRRKQPLYVVVEILDAENVGHARSAGADEVIETTRLGFSMLCHAVVHHHSGDIMGAITAAGAHSLYLGCPPEGTQLPMAFVELAAAVRAETGVLVIGVHHDDQDEINPPDDRSVTSEMLLIYLSDSEKLPTPE